MSTTATFSSIAAFQSGLSGTSWGMTGLNTSTTYFWQVNATDAAGTGSWSAMWSFVTMIPASRIPVLTLPSNGTTDQPTTMAFSWSSVVGAASYAIQVSTASDISSIAILQNVIPRPPVIATGLFLNTMYYWHVNAAFQDSVGAWSGIWSFSTIRSSVLPAKDFQLERSFSIRKGTITYFLDRQSPVTIRIYDLLGKKNFEINHLQSAGNYSFSMKALNLSGRLFIIQFKAGYFEKQITVIEE
jgi:hypothetical protein